MNLEHAPGDEGRTLAHQFIVAWASTIALRRALVPTTAIGRIPFGKGHIFALRTPPPRARQTADGRQLNLQNMILHSLQVIVEGKKVESATWAENSLMTVVSLTVESACGETMEVFQLALSRRKIGATEACVDTIKAEIITNCRKLEAFCNTLPESDGTWKTHMQVKQCKDEDERRIMESETTNFDNVFIDSISINDHNMASWILAAADRITDD